MIARTSPTASRPDAPLAAVTEHGAGRVVVLADSDLFGDDCIGELDHEALWLNLVYWAAQPAFAGVQAVTDSPPPADPAWAELKDAVEELRAHPGARRLGRPAEHDAGRLAELVEAIADAAAGLARHFPHQRDYIEALARRPARTGSTPASRKPDFVRSIEAFRPERDRRDGIEHLVVFPMYKQNASRDTCFEALIVRVPWPDFVAELERSGYDNPKFVPVNFVDYTVGLRLRVRGPLPRDLLHRRAPAQPTSAASSATARPSASAASAARAAELLRPQPAARRRLPADLAGALRWTPTSSGT